jgi:hypothetical protein
MSQQRVVTRSGQLHAITSGENNHAKRERHFLGRFEKTGLCTLNTYIYVLGMYVGTYVCRRWDDISPILLFTDHTIHLFISLVIGGFRNKYTYICKFYEFTDEIFYE